jgi:small multidrug resistance pump
MFGIVIAGYLLAFAGLAVALSEGMGLGVAYGIWAATGVAATALLSKVIFGEPLTWTMVAGLGLIMGGVLLVELGAH